MHREHVVEDGRLGADVSRLRTELLYLSISCLWVMRSQENLSFRTVLANHRGRVVSVWTMRPPWRWIARCVLYTWTVTVPITSLVEPCLVTLNTSLSWTVAPPWSRKISCSAQLTRKSFTVRLELLTIPSKNGFTILMKAPALQLILTDFPESLTSNEKCGDVASVWIPMICLAWMATGGTTAAGRTTGTRSSSLPRYCSK